VEIARNAKIEAFTKKAIQYSIQSNEIEKGIGIVTGELISNQNE
jgi:hypothetical protein